jgi:hypothetical protein
MLRITDLKSLFMPNIDTSQLSKRSTILDEELSRLNDKDAKVHFTKALTSLRSTEELTPWFEHQNENLIASLTELAAAPR